MVHYHSTFISHYCFYIHVHHHFKLYFVSMTSTLVYIFYNDKENRLVVLYIFFYICVNIISYILSGINFKCYFWQLIMHFSAVQFCIDILYSVLFMGPIIFVYLTLVVFCKLIILYSIYKFYYCT